MLWPDQRFEKRRSSQLIFFIEHFRLEKYTNIINYHTHHHHCDQDHLEKAHMIGVELIHCGARDQYLLGTFQFSVEHRHFNIVVVIKNHIMGIFSWSHSHGTMYQVHILASKPYHHKIRRSPFHIENHPYCD